MAKSENNLVQEIKKWVVNDYFTPNIKAEVILDALLTRYAAEIIEEQFRDGPCFQGTLCFVTKEMSVLDLEKPKEKPTYGNMGTKIDYVLADDWAFYLVELKTTDSSIKQTQADRYRSNCSGNGKTFGTVFGQKLLSIVKDAFAKTYAEEFHKKFGEDPAAWNDETLEAAFQLVFDTAHLGSKYDVAAPSHCYAEAAKRLIQKAGWAQTDDTRSRKYLYTMGQLLDYRTTIGRQQELTKDTFWSRPLKLIYLTPYGSLPHKDYLQDPEFYLHPKGKGSVSLIKAGKYLMEKIDDDFARLLADIITEIYLGDRV